jgi:hypothetical protein
VSIAVAFAAPVENQLRRFEPGVEELRRGLELDPPEPDSVAWVQTTLRTMVEEDRYTRQFATLPLEEGYGVLRYWYFWLRFRPRTVEMEQRHVRELKRLLARHGWIRRSRFGAEADSDAWLIAHHADLDRAFQKEVLAVLEGEAARGETAPEHYARLYDRVAVREDRDQRYGTQGRCLGPGIWEPRPIEDPARVNARRRSAGLPPMEVQRSFSASRCHYADRS